MRCRNFDFSLRQYRREVIDRWPFRVVVVQIHLHHQLPLPDKLRVHLHPIPVVDLCARHGDGTDELRITSGISPVCTDLICVVFQGRCIQGRMHT